MGNADPIHPRVAMVQDGARRRYMVPLALQNAGILERVYSDWFVRRGSLEERFARLVHKIRPHLGQKMAERSCPELDPRRVVRNPVLALRLRLKMPKFPTSEDSYIWASHQTARWILRKGFGRANALYGFIRNAAPELYHAAKAQGLRTAGDQIIAPLEVEVAEMQKQLRRWPGWNDAEAVAIHPEYLQLERQTWQCLDQITCMSPYVRDGLISVGVPAKRITVIPYPWTQSDQKPIDRPRPTGPLTVGFVGAVGLRKGSPYFLEVARRFDPRRVRFVMVGNVMLNAQKLGDYQDRVQFVGPVPRSQVRQWMQRFDVFFFPSTCEGSAGAVMEAMASALPVLTTYNSGSSARDGIEGFIRRYDDIDGFAQAIGQLDDDRDLLQRMGAAARQRALSYDLSSYEKALLEFFTQLLADSASA